VKKLPSDEDIILLINAIQLCIKSKITGFVRYKDDKILTLSFTQITKDDKNLDNIFKLLRVHWNKQNESYQFDLTAIDISLLTNFFILSRLKKENMIELAFIDKKYQPLIEQLGLKIKKESVTQINNLDDAINRIFEEIKRKGLTIREVSEKTGLTQASISNFKAGRDIRLSNLIKMIHALGLDLKIH